MSQPGFFDLDECFEKLNESAPLVSLDNLVEWENFRETLGKVREKARKSNAGRKSLDVVLMFKVLVLQHLYNLSDDQTEYQIRDRYSFCRFLGLSPGRQGARCQNDLGFQGANGSAQFDESFI